VLVVSGSGISAESGIPTFRGKDGYWHNLDPTKLATKAAFLNDPELVWDWYRERRALIHRSNPNPAHVAIVQLAVSVREFFLLTQNVDDLHARAVSNDRRLSAHQVVQIHGDIFATRCLRCDFFRNESAEDLTGVPTCPKCGSPLRPGVVWFDEELSPPAELKITNFLSSGPCDFVIAVGTTATFDYIRKWTLEAKGSNGRLIEINPAGSALSIYATEVIREPAALALPKLVERLFDAPAL
jgi:NAD-dependent deacetylase